MMQMEVGLLRKVVSDIAEMNKKMDRFIESTHEIDKRLSQVESKRKPELVCSNSFVDKSELKLWHEEEHEKIVDKHMLRMRAIVAIIGGTIAILGSALIANIIGAI